MSRCASFTVLCDVCIHPEYYNILILSLCFRSRSWPFIFYFFCFLDVVAFFRFYFESPTSRVTLILPNLLPRDNYCRDRNSFWHYSVCNSRCSLCSLRFRVVSRFSFSIYTSDQVLSHHRPVPVADRHITRQMMVLLQQQHIIQQQHPAHHRNHHHQQQALATSPTQCCATAAGSTSSGNVALDNAAGYFDLVVTAAAAAASSTSYHHQYNSQHHYNNNNLVLHPAGAAVDDMAVSTPGNRRRYYLKNGTI